MIKKDFRYILKRVIVALLIAFILSFLKSNKVLAATKPEIYWYQFYYYQCTLPVSSSCSSSQSYTTWNEFTSNGFTNFAYIKPKSMMVRSRTTTNTNEYFLKGYNYNWSFYIEFSSTTTDMFPYLFNVNPVFYFYNGSDYIQSNSITSSGVISTNNSRLFQVNVSWVMPEDSRYVLIGWEGGAFVPESPVSSIIGFKLYESSITSSSDPIITSIDRQTGALSSKIQSVIDKITDTINSINSVNSSTNNVKTSVDSVKSSVDSAKTQLHNDLNSILNTTLDSITTSNLGNWKSGNESGQATGGSGMSGLVGLPGTFINAYVNGFNGTCQSVNLGNLYGTDLILPCFDPSVKLGAIWNLIDLLFSSFMIYNIARRFVQMFNKFTNLESNQVDELYGGGV